MIFAITAGVEGVLVSSLDFKSRGAYPKGVGMVGSIPIRSRQFSLNNSYATKTPSPKLLIKLE